MWTRVVVLGLSLLVGAFTLSGTAGEKAKGQDDMAAEFMPVDQMASMIKKLSRATDLWHDANLKGDRSQVVKTERVIFDVIQADIEFSRDQVKKERHAADSIGNVVHVEKAKQAAGMLRVKERLIKALRRSEAFSNKYRLLGDYIDVLKMERRANSVELVEGTGQMSADNNEGER